MINDDHYTDWYCEEEDRLREDFLMQYTQRELLEHIRDCDRESFFEIHYDSYEMFCTEQYELFKESLGVKEC